MAKDGKIRVVALGLIRRDDRLFVSQGYDPVTNQTFYRFLGGGVEFGETSQDALKREFQEEIQADLTDIRYLGCLENVFAYKGKQAHEVIQLYQCGFANPEFYQIDKLIFVEKKRKKKALWVDISQFKSGELLLFPESAYSYF